MDDAVDRAAWAKRGSPFLTTDEAAHYIGLAKQTLQKMRRERRGPPYRKHGRFVRYHIDDLDAWSEANSALTDRRRPEPDSPPDDDTQ